MLQSCADCGTCIATACGTCNKGRMGGSRRSKDAEIRLLGCLIHPMSENCGPTCRRMAATVFACASFDCSESLSAFPASPLTRSAPRHAHPRCDAHAAGPSLPLSCTVETCIARDDATAATLNAREDNVPWAALAGTSRARRILTTRGVCTFHSNWSKVVVLWDLSHYLEGGARAWVGEARLQGKAAMNPSVLGSDVDACFSHFTRRVAELALHSEANRTRYSCSKLRLRLAAPPGIRTAIDSNPS